MHVRTFRAQRLLLVLTVPFAAMNGQPADPSRGYTSVTVKANTDSLPFAALNIPPGPLTLRGVTLKKLIMDAYAMPGFRVTGGPSWVSTDRWDFRLQTDRAIMGADQYC